MARRSAAPETPPASCPEKIRELVDRFRRNQDAYRAPAYNETQVRREFIDPFFAALGWDVDNEQGLAQAYKEVIHEDAIKIGGATKAPDYCFRIGGTRKFFVEAKKPAVGVRDDPEPAFQLRRYAWSAKLPLSILTDFEEFAVYDCRIRPDSKDKPAKARVLYLTCDEYANRWMEIALIFSKDAVLKGSFDKYAESARGKRGTTPVDDEFLKEIESWREALARNFALRNKGLSVRDLNFAVGRTIDRVIFLRMCEDRGIEPYGRLQSLLNGDAVYARLAELFRAADDKYNAGLFYFRQEADRGPPDELTLGLSLDDKVLKDILGRLYYPDSPYEFGVLSADILGQVYEQFLGKVIRLTAGHQAKVEEKPEVRKAGGVYYTPTYIVDYIVKHTVGKLLEGKSPADVGPDRETKTGKPKKIAKSAAMLRVLDPACGSGSFLLGAYQYLLDWHRDWYVSALAGPSDQSPDHEATQSPDRKGGGSGNGPGDKKNPLADARGSDQFRDRIYQASGGQWRLTIREKKRILLNNIYGVDIDPQAVEVTKLSLLLKVLEGETAETVGSTLRLFHERALPDLSNNIKCGNSLIGPDFYEGRQLDMFDEEERYRINAFDWKTEFPEVFPSRRSDATVSGPSRRSDATVSGPSRPSHAAVEPGDDSPGSDPNKPSRDREGAGSNSGGFDAVIGNPPYVLMQDEFRDDDQLTYFRLHYSCATFKLDTYHLFMERAICMVREGGWSAMITPANFLTNNHLDTLRRFLLAESDIEHILVVDGGVFRGISVDNAIWVVRRASKPTSGVCVLHARSDPTGLQVTTRYAIARKRILSDQHVLFTGAASHSAHGTWDRCVAVSTPLGTIAHVNFGKQLRDRKVFTKDVITVSSQSAIPAKYRPCYTGRDVERYVLRWGRLACLNDRVAQSGGCWDDEKQNARQKLITRQIGRNPVFAIDEHGFQCLNTVFMVSLKDDEISRLFLLGVLNSRLMATLWVQRFYDQRRTFPKIKGTYLKDLPIRTIDFDNPADKTRHDLMVSLVQRMLDLHKRLPAAKTDHERTVLQRDIDATDREIDRLVYELYGLTEEEIRIVEEATA